MAIDTETIEVVGWRSKVMGAFNGAAGRFLLALLVIYVAKQALTVVVFPPFSGHDEVAHYNYIATVAEERRVPTLFRCPTDKGQNCLDSLGRLTNIDFETWQGDELPDYFYRYCQFLLDWSPCDPDDPRWAVTPFRAANWGFIGQFPTGTQYVANHPPLYYALMAPAYRLSRGVSVETRQYIFRALAIPLGLLTVVLAFLTTRTLFPNDRFLEISVPAFVAFQPQISYESAMVNNDILGIMLVSLVLYFLARGVRGGFNLALAGWIGFALGLAMLAKSNSIIAIPAIVFAIIAGEGIRDWKKWLPPGLVAAIAAAITVAPWYYFFRDTYGNFDAFAQIRTLQSPWNKPGGTWTELLFNRGFVWNRWRETWGAFGWRRIQLDGPILWAIAAPMIIALIGLAVFMALSFYRKRRGNVHPGPLGYVYPMRGQAISLGTFVVASVTAYLAIIQFGTQFSLTQARYYFPVVNAVAILIFVGLRTVTPLALQPLVRGLVVFALVMMNVAIYTQDVIPYWHILRL